MTGRRRRARLWLVGAAWLFCSAGCDGSVRKAGRFPVGVTTVSLRSRPDLPAVIAEVWYPAATSTMEQPQVYGGGYRGRAARDAPLRDTHRYPLVLLSHGMRGGRYDLSWVGEALAADGAVAVAVEHSGSAAASFDEKEASKIWVRAQTLSHALDAVLQSVPFGAVVEARHVAAVGHSLGGSTVLLLGGARLDATLFATYFPESAPADTQSRFDARIRAVAALAPGTGPAFVSAGIAQNRAPTLIYSGSLDWYTPEEDNARLFAENSPNAVWHRLDYVTHYTFEPECTWYGKLRARALCIDKWQVRRHMVHEEVVNGLRAFLARAWAD